MNEPFGDAHPDLPMPPREWQCMDDLCPDEATLRRKRVLALARELLLHDNVYRTLDQYIIRAEEWIRAEDAYTLPEDM